MKDSNNNIKFNYLYRDEGNYKVFGSVIFENPENNSLPEIESGINQSLIDGEFFDPVKWDVPALSFPQVNEEIDHKWNEFENVEFTSESITDKRSINSFLKEIFLFLLI